MPAACQQNTRRSITCKDWTTPWPLHPEGFDTNRRAAVASQNGNSSGLPRHGLLWSVRHTELTGKCFASPALLLGSREARDVKHVDMLGIPCLWPGPANFITATCMCAPWMCVTIKPCLGKYSLLRVISFVGRKQQESRSRCQANAMHGKGPAPAARIRANRAGFVEARAAICKDGACLCHVPYRGKPAHKHSS